MPRCRRLSVGHTPSGVLTLVSASPTGTYNYNQIAPPASFNGSRFRVPPRPRRSGSSSALVENEPADAEPPQSGSIPCSGKPHPIHHFTPRPEGSATTYSGSFE